MATVCKQKLPAITAAVWLASNMLKSRSLGSASCTSCCKRRLEPHACDSSQTAQSHRMLACQQLVMVPEDEGPLTEKMLGALPPLTYVSVPSLWNWTSSPLLLFVSTCSVPSAPCVMVGPRPCARSATPLASLQQQGARLTPAQLLHPSSVQRAAVRNWPAA